MKGERRITRSNPGPKDHFASVAKEYSKYRPRYPRALFEHIAAQAPGRSLAWDCATGSGQAAVGLTPFFDKVLATDLSESQLSRAQKHPRVEYRVATAESSPLKDASADLVTVASAVHWFEFDRFYAEVRRVLKPGGVLAVWCYSESRMEEPELDAFLRRYGSRFLGPFWPKQVDHVWDRYRTIPFPFRELPAPGLTLEVEWTLPEVLGFLSSWSAHPKYIELRGADPVETIAGPELKRLWGDPERKRRVTWPIHMRIGRP